METTEDAAEGGARREEARAAVACTATSAARAGALEAAGTGPDMSALAAADVDAPGVAVTVGLDGAESGAPRGMAPRPTTSAIATSGTASNASNASQTGRDRGGVPSFGAERGWSHAGAVASRWGGGAT